SYSPNEHGYEGVLAIRASANGVSLYFNRGNELPDPAKLLQGSGKQTRSINVEGASTLARPEVARLIDEAIARNPVPFARAGRGSVVIRSATTPGKKQNVKREKSEAKDETPKTRAAKQPPEARESHAAIEDWIRRVMPDLHPIVKRLDELI